MLKKIDHVGIAVRSLQEVKKIFKTVFDLEPEFEETVEDQQVKVAGFKIGESKLEFLEPTKEDSVVAKFLSRRGEGLHHLALSVSDINKVINLMINNNIKLIDESPKRGAEGKSIAFVHPKSMNGVLLELSQAPEE